MSVTTDAPPRTGESVARDPILRIVKKHCGRRGALIAVLEDVQAEYGYLPEAALRAVAERMSLSLVDVYGVATFYRSFSLQPRGRHLILVCVGTACHVRGAPMVIEEALPTMPALSKVDSVALVQAVKMQWARFRWPLVSSK